jgi:hypothetical protein
MLLAMSLYTLAASKGACPFPTILVLGSAALLATLIVSWHLPRDPEALAITLTDDKEVNRNPGT